LFKMLVNLIVTR